MPEGKTIGQLMEEMRQKAGAQNYHGHDYMDLQRFAENTRHMIIFDVLTHDSPVGWKGERTRLFLSDKGYSHIIDEDRCINAQRLEKAFYSSKTPDPVEDTEPETADTAVTESDESDAVKILELLKNPETAALLKQLAKAL